LIHRRERFAAAIVAAIGTPWAFVLARFATERNLRDPGAAFILLLFVGPGFVVYVGLIMKAFGNRVPLDPYGTWLGAVTVNGMWLLLLDRGSNDEVLSTLVVASVVSSIVVSLIGLTAADNTR